MAAIKITFHKKLNAAQCMCGFVGTSHKCKEEIRGKIVFVNCSEENCNFVKIRFIEMNIMSRDGPQMETVT